VSEIPDVVGGETILTSWGNPIRDRVISRYADATERATLVPVPIVGDPSYLEGSASLELYNGAAWIPYLPTRDGAMTGDLYLAGFNIRDAISLRALDGAVFDIRGGVSTHLIRIRISDETILYDSAQIARVTIKEEGSLELDANTKVIGQMSAANLGAYARGGGWERAIGARNAADTVPLGGMLLAGGDDVLNHVYIGTASADYLIRASLIDGTVRIGSTFGYAPTNEGVVRNIYTGTTPPDSGLGSVGDVYLQVNA